MGGREIRGHSQMIPARVVVATRVAVGWVCLQAPMVTGGAADHAGSLAYVEAARPVYSLLGAPQDIVWLNHQAGHACPLEARRAAGAFLDRHLKLR